MSLTELACGSKEDRNYSGWRQWKRGFAVILSFKKNAPAFRQKHSLVWREI